MFHHFLFFRPLEQASNTFLSSSQGHATFFPEIKKESASVFSLFLFLFDLSIPNRGNVFFYTFTFFYILSRGWEGKGREKSNIIVPSGLVWWKTWQVKEKRGKASVVGV